MTIANGYTTLVTAKGRDELNISDTNSDTLIESIIEAASRTIDSDCGRYFYKSASAETRYYTPEFSDKLFLFDDIVSITELATDSSDARTYPDIWSASDDYDLAPYNASSRGWPYTAIEVRPTGNYSFSLYRKSVKLTAVFGFPAVPSKIEQACLLLTMRIFKRLSAPLGVLSMSALGEVTVSIKDKDPDYWHLISEFTRKI